MAIKGNFNRIINLTLNKASGDPTFIKCPLKGRKPKIEINGTWTTDVDMPAFNITIQNLYLDILRDQYSSIEVECGYEGNTKTIKGDIITMYQESPGPEGRTVIQCVYGRLQQWLDATVDLHYKSGTPIGAVLEEIKDKINAERVMFGVHAAACHLKADMNLNGTARDALNYLVNQFQDEKLSIYPHGREIRAICVSKGDSIGTARILEYISAPPQENTGGDEGTYYTTINAPWMPELSIGDKLEIPSKVYIRNFATVGGASKTQNIQVTTMSFHFGTVGNVNSMTVQGFLVR